MKNQIKKVHNFRNRIRIIDLSRNFGHHKAIMTGLHYAKGDYVFLIDSDLEEDPEYYKSLSAKLEALIEKHQEHWDELVQLLLNFRDDMIDDIPLKRNRNLGVLPLKI